MAWGNYLDWDDTEYGLKMIIFLNSILIYFIRWVCPKLGQICLHEACLSFWFGNVSVLIHSHALVIFYCNCSVGNYWNCLKI